MMEKESVFQRSKQNIALYSAAIAFVALVREVMPTEGGISIFAGLFNSLAYLGLILIWGYSVMQQIQSKDMRRWLMGVSALMLVWFLMRMVKYRYFEGVIVRYLWYGFYIPLTLIPLFSFLGHSVPGGKSRCYQKNGMCCLFLLLF